MRKRTCHSRHLAARSIPRKVDQRYMKLWARRGPGPGVTDVWGTDRGGYRRSGTPLALGACGGVAEAAGGPLGRIAALRSEDAVVCRRRGSPRPLAGLMLAGSMEVG